jgi:hypothetical protein
MHVFCGEAVLGQAEQDNFEIFLFYFEICRYFYLHYVLHYIYIMMTFIQQIRNYVINNGKMFKCEHMSDKNLSLM